MRTLITDSLGRATFHHIEPRTGVRPTAREVQWLKHIERHGPQSSEMLFELTRDTHRSKDTSLRDLQKLRSGGFLWLPHLQRATERAEFNPYIYDLTKGARDYLSGLGLAEPTLRPKGHWWHGYTVSAFTGSFDILARRQGRDFIPGHRILGRHGADLAIPVSGRQIIPDQVFAIQYDEGYRAFLLEVDRGTEPARSRQARKSLSQSIDVYTEMFASNAHRRHYGLKATTLSLWVFSDPVRLNKFRKLAQERAGQWAGHFLCKDQTSKLTWTSLELLHRKPWLTGAGDIIDGV